MTDNTRFENAKQLALALKKHSGEWGLMQQLALRMQYDPQQLRQDIHDLAAFFADKSDSIRTDSAVKSGLRSNTMTEDDWAKIESLTSDAFESCPFCGEKKASLQKDITQKRLNPAMNNDKYASPFFVECGVCSARGGFDLDPYEAIRKWNDR